MATSANAAHLSDIQGAVLVNNQPVSASAEVAQGDRIKVVNGSAVLVYSSGAAISITSGQTIVVLANPPEQVSMKDGGNLPSPYIYGGALVVAGGAGLAIALSQAGKPASP
jgi:hypothetical protein